MAEVEKQDKGVVDDIRLLKDEMISDFDRLEAVLERAVNLIERQEKEKELTKRSLEIAKRRRAEN